MKKILLIAAVAALGAVSCQKDRTCSCTTSSSLGGQSTSQDIVYKNATKSQAKAGCVSTKETDPNETITTDCKLK
jgi:hypothetical protein